MCDLSGQRIVVTRARHQSGRLTSELRSFGAEVLHIPVIEIAPPADPRQLRDAATHLDAYDWIVFTSANAVAALAAELAMGTYPKAKIAAVGASTRAAAEQSGFSVCVVPDEYVAESLVEALGKQSLKGKRILIPSAAVTREVVPDALRSFGAEVEIVEAYRNVVPREAIGVAAEIFRDPFPEWLTFASPSAVDHLFELVGQALLRKSKIVTIGPVTSAALHRYGLQAVAEASTHDAHGLVEALCKAIRLEVSRTC